MNKLTASLMTMGLCVPLYAAAGEETGDKRSETVIEESEVTKPASTLMEFVGTVVVREVEGGFYGILADDGSKYLPLYLPEVFRQSGLRVRLLARVAPDMKGFQQWGRYLHVLDIVPSACPPPATIPALPQVESEAPQP